MTVSSDQGLDLEEKRRPPYEGLDPQGRPPKEGYRFIHLGKERRRGTRRLRDLSGARRSDPRKEPPGAAYAGR